MQFAWRTLIGLSVVLALSTHAQPDLPSFLQRYCIDCHGPDKQKGDRAFHELSLTDAEALTDILDQLNLGEMPPDKKGVSQPPVSELRKTIAELTQTVTALENESTPKNAAMRRLNRREYRNTMRDLLGLGQLAFDPTASFPADEKAHGFTNIGTALNLSDAHLDSYLDAAQEYLSIAFHFGHRPKSRTIRFNAGTWGYPNREATTPWMYRVHSDKYLDIGAGQKNLARHNSLATYPRDLARAGGIHRPGYYRISINAEAVRRLTHPYDPKMIPTDLGPPMQLGLYVSDGTAGLVSGGVNARRRLALWDLQDHETKTYEVTVWLGAGAVPFLNWDNGPGPSDYWMRDILTKYHTDIEFRGKQGSHAWHIIGKDAVPGRIVSDVWQGPVLRVHNYELTGPLPETFASPIQRQICGDLPLKDVNWGDAYAHFARLAFRRPLRPHEILPYLQISRHARQERGRSGADSFLIGLQAMLVSADFLYLKEDSERLAPHQIANRLSYFLWSSMPDAELSALADSATIGKPEILRAQALRMLADPKSDALIGGLADSWLRLDKLGSMPPDSLRFQSYYRHDLEAAMRQETHHFLRHMIQENRPLSDFLDSNYSFLNQDLARLYALPDVSGSHFRRVSLPKDSPRGGLLGQASILTLSANGVDTSPVVRGTWVLESLLGTPPPPPPPDVDPLDPDVRGAVGIRQRLEKHRRIEACADCHAKIDPFGFPLEHFDAIGAYRETYFRYSGRRRIPARRINGFAALPSGERFKDMAGLRRVLRTREPQLRRGLSRTLATYASGRNMTFHDTAQLEQISASSNFRDLILAVIESELFTTR
jgi:hypothetical protein